ncbi:hypothetical protein ACLOJK_011837 [Asimina triloba]
MAHSRDWTEKIVFLYHVYVGFLHGHGQFTASAEHRAWLNLTRAVDSGSEGETLGNGTRQKARPVGERAVGSFSSQRLGLGFLRGCCAIHWDATRVWRPTPDNVRAGGKLGSCAIATVYPIQRQRPTGLDELFARTTLSVASASHFGVGVKRTTGNELICHLQLKGVWKLEQACAAPLELPYARSLRLVGYVGPSGDKHSHTT